VRRPSRTQLQRFFDVAIPIAVGGFLALATYDAALDEPEALRGLGMVLGLAQGAALWWRRKYPDRVMAITLVGGLGTQLIAPEIMIPFAGMFAIASLAAARPPRVSLPALVALVAVAATSFLTQLASDTAFVMAIAVVPWALGEAARNRRAAIEQEARRAVTEEQARIARELHDVIAHSVSVIVVQAGAADDVFERRPDQARAALRSIESTGREAMRELRLLLGAVRPGEGEERSDPKPGLDRLDELAGPLRSAGLAVSVQREGRVRELSSGVDLSAYRIVQEALTNTLRHARATRADVTVRYLSDMLELDVLDDGRGGAPATQDGGRHGIVGMRERAAMLGGTLDAGSIPSGGYRVHARLPLETAL
jgi:signal transduction histidine kinase